VFLKRHETKTAATATTAAPATTNGYPTGRRVGLYESKFKGEDGGLARKARVPAVIRRAKAAATKATSTAKSRQDAALPDKDNDNCEDAGPVSRRAGPAGMYNGAIKSAR
jgi:hypothetical protein